MARDDSNENEKDNKRIEFVSPQSGQQYRDSRANRVKGCNP